MNGTTLRIATVATCIAALAAPSSALAKKHHKAHHRAHKAAKLPRITTYVPHIYDAGGNGIELVVINGRISLINALGVATALGDQALSQLGLPSVETLTSTGGLQIPTVPLP